MRGPGFYRIDPSGELLYAESGIATPTGVYAAADHAIHTYPIDGAWRYFESEAAALSNLAPSQAVPQIITRRQCARQMFARGMITGEELVAMVATGTPPAAVEAVFAQMPEPDVYIARADFAAVTYERSNPLLIAVMTASGATASDIDTFFAEASAF